MEIKVNKVDSKEEDHIDAETLLKQFTIDNDDNTFTLYLKEIYKVKIIN